MTGDWARQDIFTGISDKVIISVLLKEDPHTQAPFVYFCQAELRVEISLPQQLTSASCFLFPWPPLRPSCRSLFGQTEKRTHSLDCCCDVIAVGCCLKVHVKPKSEPSPKTGQRGMSKPGQIFCSSQLLSGNKSNDQENGKFLWE